MIDDAQGADVEPIIRGQRGSGIKPDIWRATNERIVEESIVVECVGYDEHVFFEDGVRTKRDVTRRFGGIETHARLEPLPLGIDEGNQGDGHAANTRGEFGQVVKAGFRGCIEDGRFTQSRETIDFVGGKRGNFHRMGSRCVNPIPRARLILLGILLIRARKNLQDQTRKGHWIKWFWNDANRPSSEVFVDFVFLNFCRHEYDGNLGG